MKSQSLGLIANSTLELPFRGVRTSTRGAVFTHLRIIDRTVTFRTDHRVERLTENGNGT